jgi:hypothetical protein
MTSKKRETTSRRKRGLITAWFAAGMVPLIGVMGLSLDLGQVAVKQSQLQSYVDAKAVAFLKERFGNFGASSKVRVDQFLDAPGIAEAVMPSQVSIWDFSVGQLRPPNTPIAAGRAPAVPATLANFDVPLFFGPLFGVDKVTLEARAIAYAPRREVVIVQDVSGSMTGTFMTQAKAAVTQVINEMFNQNLPYDRMGLVTFDSNAYPVTDPNGGMNPVFLANGRNALVNKVAGWQAVGGTNVPSGLQMGIGMFAGPPSPETERLLILVGDGQDGNLNQSKQLVQDAWDDQRIHTYTILIGNNGADYLSQLPRGRGTFKQTAGADLDDLLTSIVTSIPMRLVE